MIKHKFRGNEIEYDNKNKIWLFSDTKEDVPSTYKTKKCGRCGEHYTKEGHDNCLGTLIGLMNACCGHGNTNEAYVQFLDGNCVRGKDAIKIQEILKKYSNENFLKGR